MRDALYAVLVLCTLGFALRWKREDTIRALGEEAGEYLRAEIRRNARSQLVRVLGLSLLGAAGISYGPRAFVQYQQWQVANVGHTVTRFSDVSTGVSESATPFWAMDADTTTPTAMFAADADFSALGPIANYSLITDHLPGRP